MIENEIKYFLDKFLFSVAQRYKRKMIFQPLRVVFHLAAPIAITHPWIHFDGLIGHLLTVEALGEGYYLLPRKFPLSRLLHDVELPAFPIKETKGLYHASVSIFDTEKQGLEILYKKFEDRWAGGKKKIVKGGGYFRDYMIQHIYIPARTVTFYICGDKDVINHLCQYVIGLGDNTRVGWGRVRCFELETIPNDWSIVKDGKAMRPIPHFFLKRAGEVASVAWKPPYWAAESVDWCAVPGTEVELEYELA